MSKHSEITFQVAGKSAKIKLDQQNTLGSGSFGTVYKGFDVENPV